MNELTDQLLLLFAICLTKRKFAFQFVFYFFFGNYLQNNNEIFCCLPANPPHAKRSNNLCISSNAAVRIAVSVCVLGPCQGHHKTFCVVLCFTAALKVCRFHSHQRSSIIIASVEVLLANEKTTELSHLHAKLCSDMLCQLVFLWIFFSTFVY